MSHYKDSDDDLICIEDGPKKEWPTDDEIDEKIKVWAMDEIEIGKDAKDMKLLDILKRFNNCGYTGKFNTNTDMIRKVCKSLRKWQRWAAEQSKAQPETVQYYKGNISTIDIATLNSEEWLNDKIMNRYLALIGEKSKLFVPISSFFLESLTSSVQKTEIIPDLENKIGLIPCNRNHHWSLIVIFHHQRTVLLFDSMGNLTDLDTLLLLNKLRSHLNKLHDTKYKVLIHKKVKSQNNSDDCGVHVLMWARSLMEGATHLNILGTQKHMILLRKFFKEEIMDAKLRDWTNFLRESLKLPNQQKLSKES